MDVCAVLTQIRQKHRSHILVSAMEILALVDLDLQIALPVERLSFQSHCHPPICTLRRVTFAGLRS